MRSLTSLSSAMPTSWRGAGLVAAEVCRQQGSVSINDVRERIQTPRATCNPSVLGAVFRTKQFVKMIGLVTEANHPQAHATQWCAFINYRS
jgi:hypothetical protein